MGVLRESSSWCFCTGGSGGRSGRIKSSIFSGKGSAVASIISPAGGGGGVPAAQGTGFLIHWGLLLTTHTNIPSVPAAKAAVIRLNRSHFAARLVPHRFFITSSVLDLTIVGVDIMEGDSSQRQQQPHYLRFCCNPRLDLGSTVYLLGHTDKKDLTIGEGKVVIATDNLIKLSAEGVLWCPGSAGFDVQGNLAFMVCDPMKLISSSPTSKSSPTSSSSVSCKKDITMQFGIPIPIICDWLYQHWEGNLDEPSKPKLPLMRLMSTGQRSDRSSASFIMRKVFKSMEGDDNNSLSSSQLIVPKSRCHVDSSNSAKAEIFEEGSQVDSLPPIRGQGIPTPEIYESPKLTSEPIGKEPVQVQLLDTNFPSKGARSIVLPLPLRHMLVNPPESSTEDANSQESVRKDNDCCSEVQSSSSPVEISYLRNDKFSSDEETMYSAETMESRNYPSPKEGNKLQRVGRSKSCVNYSRWMSTPRSSVTSIGTMKKQHSMVPVRKTHSQAAVTPQKGHDYFSPTVSSSMKKRNNVDQTMRPRRSAVNSSPRWMF